MRNRLLVVVTAIALVFSHLTFSNAVANAETCPTYDLSDIFDEEYFVDIKWDTANKPRTLTWTSNATVVNKVSVARPFNNDELGWLQIAFDSWDLALDSINFQKVDNPSSANIVIGLTPLQNNGFWTVEIPDTGQAVNYRTSGTIQISSTTPIILTREGFIEVAQSEIGNMLGLGDIQHSIESDSVMLDPDQPPFGEPVLNDFDITLIRQFYGESTCKSAWPTALVKAKADWEEVKAKAIRDAQEKADAEARAKAKERLEAEAKAEAESQARARAELKGKKRTIICVKGKKSKKITAVKPVCPKGYKRK